MDNQITREKTKDKLKQADGARCKVQASPTSSLSLPSPATNSKPSHSPNMIIDIAQTCHDSFPFALIAERHNQPLRKVQDVFSAIIQLPLLRSATDRRRTGKLATERMKDFRRMNNAVRELHVEERRKERQGGAVPVDPSVPKTKVRRNAKASGLLKTAVTNNARGLLEKRGV